MAASSRDTLTPQSLTAFVSSRASVCVSNCSTLLVAFCCHFSPQNKNKNATKKKNANNNIYILCGELAESDSENFVY